jgi:hypothetical protein
MGEGSIIWRLAELQIENPEQYKKMVNAIKTTLKDLERTRRWGII